MKKLSILFTLMACCLMACTGGQKKTTNMETGNETLVRLETTMGNITVKLYNETPKHRDNFIKLAKEGTYDSTLFHRVIKNFMIQGGDPLGNGTGGSDKTIKGEFAQNGVENNLSHTRGVISMARSNEPDSASSQFFIVQADSTYLDGQYAAFGKVTKGMDIVDKICKDTPVTDSNGTVEKKNQPVINSIKIEEK